MSRNIHVPAADENLQIANLRRKVESLEGLIRRLALVSGVSDHGGLTGLSDDDHTQYALADGTRGAFVAKAGDTMLGNLTISNAGDVTLLLEADTDNAGGEDHNPTIIFSQDGGAIVGHVGLSSSNVMYARPLAFGAGDDNFYHMSAAGTTNKFLHEGIGSAGLDALNIGKIFDYAGPESTVPAKHLLCAGQSISRTTYALLFEALCPIVGTATATAASDRVTLTAHGLTVGDAIFFDTIAAGAAGLSADTRYFVASVVDADNVTLGTSRSVNAITGLASVSGAPINITSDGTGLVVRLNPAGGITATNFAVPDLRGRVTVALDDMNGSDAGRLGWSNLLGASAGEQNHTLLEAELPSHTHPAGTLQLGSGDITEPGTISLPRATAGAASSAAGTHVMMATTGGGAASISASYGAFLVTNGAVTGTTGGTGSGTAFNVMQPSYPLNKIIYAGA